MAGPLSGIIGNQQVASSQASQLQQQSGQNTGAIRQQDQEPDQNQVQPQGAASAETQNSATDNTNVFQQRIEELISNPQAGNAADGAEAQRGALVDVLV
jgi:hypothetical protein